MKAIDVTLLQDTVQASVSEKMPYDDYLELYKADVTDFFNALNN